MESAFDLEDYCVFLAANLMGGVEKLGRTFENFDASFPVYWKSPLLVDVTAITEGGSLSDVKTEVNEVYQVVFLDVTLSFNVKSQRSSGKKGEPSVDACFGVFLCRRGTNDFFYLRSPNATREFLRSHVDQHNIELDDTPSHVIAREMASALMDVKNGLCAEVTPVENASRDGFAMRLQQVHIPLSYEDGISQLSIVSSTGPVTKMDANIASTWIQSILSLTVNENGVDDDDDVAEESDTKEKDFVDYKATTELKAKFKEWEQKAIKGKNQVKTASEGRGTLSSIGESLPDNDGSQRYKDGKKDGNKPKIVPRVQYGRMKIPPKKKKKITYGSSK